jgi:hypothetical protein
MQLSESVAFRELRLISHIKTNPMICFLALKSLVTVMKTPGQRFNKKFIAM